MKFISFDHLSSLNLANRKRRNSLKFYIINNSNIIYVYKILLNSIRQIFWFWRNGYIYSPSILTHLINIRFKYEVTCMVNTNFQLSISFYVWNMWYQRNCVSVLFIVYQAYLYQVGKLWSLASLNLTYWKLRKFGEWKSHTVYRYNKGIKKDSSHYFYIWLLLLYVF